MIVRRMQKCRVKPHKTITHSPVWPPFCLSKILQTVICISVILEGRKEEGKLACKMELPLLPLLLQLQKNVGLAIFSVANFEFKGSFVGAAQFQFQRVEWHVNKGRGTGSVAGFKSPGSMRAALLHVGIGIICSAHCAGSEFGEQVYGGTHYQTPKP